MARATSGGGRAAAAAALRALRQRRQAPRSGRVRRTDGLILGGLAHAMAAVDQVRNATPMPVAPVIAALLGHLQGGRGHGEHSGSGATGWGGCSEARHSAALPSRHRRHRPGIRSD